MSYLQLAAGIPDFDQAVISFWFRVPQASIDAARAEWQVFRQSGDLTSRLPMGGIVPLLAFGKATKRGIPSYTTQAISSHSYTEQRWPAAPATSPCSWGTTAGYPTTVPVVRDLWYTAAEIDGDPSYIGIDCTFQDQVLLAVNFQMPGYGTIVGSMPQIVNQSLPDALNWNPPALGHCTNDPAVDATGHVLPVRDYLVSQTFASAADVRMNNMTETFRTSNASGGFGSFGQTVTPDHWHHLLLSVDLSTDCNTTGVYDSGNPPSSAGHGNVNSACKMWLAYDDTNLTGHAMGSYTDGNNIITPNAQYVLNDRIAYYNYGHDAINDGFGNWSSVVAHGLEMPRFDYPAARVPSDGEPFGIPAPAKYVDRVRPVEMAELQLWTDATLDTGDEANRRAFVTAKGEPASPADADKLLGKKPIIRFYDQADWARGRNTGETIRRDETGKPTPTKAPDFTPVGAIAAYSPEPSLHGPQSPQPQPPAL